MIPYLPRNLTNARHDARRLLLFSEVSYSAALVFSPRWHIHTYALCFFDQDHFYDSQSTQLRNDGCPTPCVALCNMSSINPFSLEAPRRPPPESCDPGFSQTVIQMYSVHKFRANQLSLPRLHADPSRAPVGPSHLRYAACMFKPLSHSRLSHDEGLQ